MKELQAISEAGYKTIHWQKYGKDRYYIKGERLMEKSSAFFSLTEESETKLGNGYLHTQKSYNGYIAKSFNEIISKYNSIN